MKKIREMRRPELTTILSTLALLVVLGGTATAASGLINGKKIERGTVTAKQVKNKTLTRDKFAPSTLDALKGTPGPRGELGQKGASGEKGANGERGTKVPTGSQGASGTPGAPGVPGTSTLSKSGPKVAQVPNLNVDQVVMSGLPGSRYIAMAEVQALSQTAGSQVICSIKASNGGGSDEARWTNPTNGTRGTLWMVLPTELPTDQMKVVCNAGGSSATIDTDLALIPAL